MWTLLFGYPSSVFPPLQAETKGSADGGISRNIAGYHRLGAIEEAFSERPLMVSMASSFVDMKELRGNSVSDSRVAEIREVEGLRRQIA
ncbi:MAG: hypothetical protein H7Y36_11035 [Armatimonadetes bacterium]|nr:hypothetical protein [Akkermansiaceae bacterium]